MKEKAYQHYLESYLRICPELKEDELDFIKENLSISEFKKKELYLKSGQVQKEMGFVYKGLLKSYYVDNQGKKVTISFINESSYAADYPSFIQQRPSKYFIETIEPTVMVNLSYAAIQKAYSKYKNLKKYGRLISEQILLKK